MTDKKLPDIVLEVREPVTAESLAFIPKTIEEWAQVQTTNTVLALWKDQQGEERKLRNTYARWVFLLMTFQVAVIFLLVVLDATRIITLKESIIKILTPAAFGELFGMGYLVVKYLFSRPSKELGEFLSTTKGARK